MNVSGLPDNVRRNVRHAAAAGNYAAVPTSNNTAGPSNAGSSSNNNAGNNSSNTNGTFANGQGSYNLGSNSRNKGSKRPLSVVQDGIEGTAQEISSDYLCPICLELMKEAHIISCGHTFCRVCLERSIENNKRCPKCNYTVYSNENIFPNHLVNQQVLKYKESLLLSESSTKKSKKNMMLDLQSYITENSSSMRAPELATLISLLEERKERLVANSEETKYKLLDAFLTELKDQKELQLDMVTKEITLIASDLGAVKSLLDKYPSAIKRESKNNEYAGVPNSNYLTEEIENPDNPSDDTQESDFQFQEGFNVPVGAELAPSSTSLAVKRKKIHLNFDDLSESYFTYRVPALNDFQANSDPQMTESLSDFGNCICKFSQFSSLRTLATIDYAGDKFPASSNIASSIEFDKDGEFFAVAGLTKKIRVFDYRNVIGDVVDIHYPSAEMVCDSKISCVSWSSYLKNKLASSDYDGDVTIWDAFTAQKLHVYKEHQKRCWSVDFNKMDTKLMASGSDDACVKLWHLDGDRSLTSLEAKANVCCVQFNPESRYHLAFGSADHCVHYYDLRKMKEPLRLFKGHKKAVSYVKFISGNEIVSASTDSQLKVWNVNTPNCTQSLRGHLNDKNFVGLATDGQYVACGSENNSLYVYYKDLPKKMISYRFDPRRIIIDPETKEEDSTDFVSAVCWRKGSNVLVTGNSQGTIKVLQMV